jgi:hypothetical protein
MVGGGRQDHRGRLYWLVSSCFLKVGRGMVTIIGINEILLYLRIMGCLSTW